MSYLGALIATPLVLTGRFGFSISVAAILMLTRTFSLTLASPLGGVIATQFGERLGTLTGVLCQTAGLFTVAAGIYVTNLPIVLLGLVLQGIGHGVAMPPLASIITTAVPPSQFGMATGMSRLMGQIGSAFGLSLFGVLLTLPRAALALHMIFVIGGAIALAAALPALFISMKHRNIPMPPAAPPPPNPPIQPGQV
ncbi:MAG: MFS transporter [Alphaproteobacteria bacterium]|nr:MFS transporter [Alphaproteobacteria bacterium]